MQMSTPQKPAEYEVKHITGDKWVEGRGVMLHFQWTPHGASWEPLDVQTRQFKISDVMMAYLDKNKLRNVNALRTYLDGVQRTGGLRACPRQRRHLASHDGDDQESRKNPIGKPVQQKEHDVLNPLPGPMLHQGIQEQQDCVHHSLLTCVGNTILPSELPTSKALTEISVALGISARNNTHLAKATNIGALRTCLHETATPLVLRKVTCKQPRCHRNTLHHITSLTSGIFIVRITLRSGAHHCVSIDCKRREVMCGLHAITLCLDDPLLSQTLRVRNWGRIFQLCVRRNYKRVS